MVADVYLWHPVIAYLWKNYQQDHPDEDKNDEEDDEEDDIDRMRFRRQKVDIDSIVVRWTFDGFQSFFKKDYQPNQLERKRMCACYVVAKCKNCKDDSSCWRVNMVQQNKEGVYSLQGKPTKEHYRTYHPVIHKHHRYASNLCPIAFKFVKNFNKL